MIFTPLLSDPVEFSQSVEIKLKEWYTFFYKNNAYKHIQAQILQKLRHCLSICWASILQNFKALFPNLQKNTHNVQILPSHKHSIGIFEAQKINFAKHNEAHKNYPMLIKKRVYRDLFLLIFTNDFIFVKIWLLKILYLLYL